MLFKLFFTVQVHFGHIELESQKNVHASKPVANVLGGAQESKDGGNW